MEVGGNELCFLDLKLTLKDNKTQTKVYSKPIDRHLHLQAHSCHHLASILGIHEGVALRVEYSNKSRSIRLI